MTEAEWFACDDFETMLDWLAWEARPDRKWRLFVLACLEPLRPHLLDERLIAALEVLAQLAEGACGGDDLNRAHASALAAYSEIRQDPNEQRWFYASLNAAATVAEATRLEARSYGPNLPNGCAHVLTLGAVPELEERVWNAANQRHVELVREIFGNPFRPVALDPLWLTSDVRALARGIYDERAFERMPILADALQDAGCENADVLNHCRDTTRAHVRGCWVLDLLLDKG